RDAMEQQARQLGLALTRLEAIDARNADPAELNRRFEANGPLGAIPKGDQCCFLSHRLAWARLVESGAPYATILEDDVRLSARAPGAQKHGLDSCGHRSHQAGTLRPRKPERAVVGLRGCGKWLSPGTHALASYRRGRLYPLAPRRGVAVADAPLRPAG